MRNILVVGGSKGIGKAIVAQLADKHKVINFSRTSPEFEHPNLTNFQVDVLADDLPELESLDGVVYCPGTINLRPFSRLDRDAFLEDFEINVLGAVRCFHKYERVLKKGENPSVVMFSTVASHMGMPFHSSVAVSKSGVEGLVMSLAAEWAPRIRVNAIAPTITDTTLAQGILRNDAMRDKMNERHPLKKILDPAEVADLALYLLSNKAASLSGQIFKMDCGMLSVRV